MKNIYKLYLTIFLLFFIVSVKADSGTSTVTWNNNVVECGTSFSHGIIHHGVPDSNSASEPNSGTKNCTTHTYYTSGDYSKPFAYNGGITACASGERVVNWNPIALTMICRKYDDTPPAISDVTNNNLDNLLANDSYNYLLTISTNGGSPIVEVDGRMEDETNQATMNVFNDNLSPWDQSWDISKVDNYRIFDSNTARQYTFRLTTIKDEAGNEWTGIKNYNHNVYANTTTMLDPLATRSVTNELTNLLNIADGSIKNLIITLKDKYGNEIVPASGISRTIDFNWDVDNTMYLNQYTRTGQSSVFLNRTTDSTSYLNRLDINASFDGETSTGGVYTYKFKVYTPTSNQDNGPVSDPAAEFNINNITYDINGTLGNTLGQSLNFVFPIISKFSPLYYTSITGEIKNNGFIDGSVQNSIISINKNASSENPFIATYLKFGGSAITKYDLKYSKIGIPSTLISTGSALSTDFGSSSGSLRTLLDLISPPAPASIDAYLSTHINYTLDLKNITYNSDIIGKDSYFGLTGTLADANQSGLKVIGIVTSNKNTAIIENQMLNDVKIIGNTEKLILKTAIVKNGYNFAKNVTGNTTNGSGITNINTHSNINNVIYFGAESLHGNKIYNLGTGADMDINSNKTILVIGGNLYIKSNLYYTGNGMLGIVVLKDKQGNGGNVYIDPSITNIVGTIFAEKSIISYNGIELDGTTEQSVLNNQLHIYGSIFSENTIGGSRKTIPECPYYITSGCTKITAQKYDLNYLRRYYLIDASLSGGTAGLKIPANGGKIIGGGTCNGAGVCAGGNTNFARNITNTTQPYSNNPVVIEYNPKLQLKPPVLFTY